MPIRWEEPFGMVMVEALACGTPVIAFPEGAARELVVDGQDRLPRRRRARDGRRGRPAAAYRRAGLPCLGRRSTATSTSSPPPTSGPTGRWRASRAGRSSRLSERTLSVLDGSTFVVGDRLGDLRADGGSRARLLLRGHALPLALGPARRRDAAGAAEPRPERALRRSVLPDSARRAGRAGAVLDHAPAARRPRVDRGDHGDQPPPRDEPRCRVVLEVDTDFADLFEVKDGAVAEREVTCTPRRARR